MRRLTLIGLSVTALYLLFNYAFWRASWSGVQIFGDGGIGPNGWGDFLAGLFGPLAFIWLVIGFFQQGQALKTQGEELQNSVRALSLQANELAASVKQQELMVEVTRQTLSQTALTNQIMRNEQRPWLEIAVNDVVEVRQIGGKFFGKFCISAINHGGRAASYVTASAFVFSGKSGIFDAREAAKSHWDERKTNRTSNFINFHVFPQKREKHTITVIPFQTASFQIPDDTGYSAIIQLIYRDADGSDYFGSECQISLSPIVLGGETDFICTAVSKGSQRFFREEQDQGKT